MYVEEVEQLQAEYESLGESSTYAVELAAGVVTDEVRALAEEACS